MEALWTFPLYIISPLIGTILTLIGILKIRKSDTNKTLYIGLGFLSLPLIHLALVSIFQLKFESKIVGNYNLGKEKDVLIVYDNETFTLNKSRQYNNVGKGKWKIEEIDSPILILDFDSIRKSELWLEIEQNEKQIVLKTIPWGNNISTEFVKK
ncbi:hypothetical protein [Flavobacterium aquicola]|uniref:Uncharacterized protein n=1 Tax=Flavobacterium aquicola TaxID=1682742 RepID=A0A3E0ERK5_9FLAO|nr:hypothetical protein [Flavobacterium aquicola]REH00853.1 hypothetical protein C8P67_102102 [Flavobacterium aquicola]